jgi:hypothetical protein
MPRGDGTGPLGMGPKTGRGAGFCTGYDVAGYANPWFGRGYFCRGGNFGRSGMPAGGRSFRWRNWYNATGEPFWARGRQLSWNWPQGQTPQQESSPANNEAEINYLKNEASILENELKNIKERLENLTKDS